MARNSIPARFFMSFLRPSPIFIWRAGARSRCMQPVRRASLAMLVCGAVLGTVLGFGPQSVKARSPTYEVLATISVSQLPPEGRATLAAIHAGGPFASPRDGIVFGNRERVLVRQRRGYYAEYTVPTPGARNRGARRIIAGRGAGGDVRSSGEYYYTDDHYQTFRRIAE